MKKKCILKRKGLRMDFLRQHKKFDRKMGHRAIIRSKQGQNLNLII